MDSAPVPASASLQARCFLHPDQDAVATCGRCGTFTCAACQQIATDGLSYCVRCLGVPVPLADRGTRFLANLIDTFVVTLPGLAGPVVALIVSRGDDEAALIGLLAGVALWLGMVGVQIYFQAAFGQSVAKRMLRIKVVRLDGSAVSVGRVVFLRNVVPHVFGTFCNLFGLADALFILGEQQRCLHDYLADTKVVRVDEVTPRGG